MFIIVCIFIFKGKNIAFIISNIRYRGNFITPFPTSDDKAFARELKPNITNAK